MSKMSVKQGESTDLFNITVEGLTDYTDYYSELTVLAADTDAPVLGPLTIYPSASNKFPVSLSPAQTAGLPVGNYTVVLIVVKDVEGVIEFRKETSWSLKVSASLLA
jgi:hypothetical protein